MNAEQKRAWFIVAVCVLSCIGFFILGFAISFRVAPAAFGLLGLAGFAGLIGRGEKADERDISIGRRAVLIGAMASYGAFILGCMGAWLVVFAWHRQGQVSVHLLGSITGFGAGVLLITWSIAVLVLYGRKVEA